MNDALEEQDKPRSLWLQPRAWWKFLKFVWCSFNYHKGVEDAKSLTYTSLFAVVPLLTLTVAVLSTFPAFQVFSAQLQDLVYSNLLPTTSVDLQQYFATFSNQARNLTWIGALMLMVTSYLMLVNVERSFNTIWGVGEVRKGLYAFLLYWSVLSLGPLLLGAGFAMSSYLTSLSLVDSLLEVPVLAGVNTLLLSVLPVLLSILGFTLLYATVPNCGVRFRHALAGGATVALVFILVKQIFTRFMSGASYELIYGTFAAVPIFLTWLYVCWVVILLGANLVRSIPLFVAQQETEAVSAHPTLLMLALLHRFWEKQQQGEVLSMEELGREKWPFSGIAIETFLDILQREKIVHAGAQGEFLLARDLRNLSLWQVLGWLPWPLPGEAELQKGLPPVLERHLPAFRRLERRFAALEDFARDEFGESLDEIFRREVPAASPAGEPGTQRGREAPLSPA